MARGRVYQCLHCKPIKITAGKKANIENHILRMHVPSYNVPYTCRLCGYKCTKTREFSWHLNNLKEHLEKSKASKDTIDESRYLVVAAKPYEIKKGKDIQRWGKKESEELWETKEKNRQPAPATAAPSQIIEPQIELASPKKLCDSERNILDEILWDEDTSFPDFSSIPVFQEVPVAIPSPKRSVVQMTSPASSASSSSSSSFSS